MTRSEWINAGALFVGAMGVIFGAVVGPVVAAYLDRRGRIRSEMSSAYADMIRLLRERLSEVAQVAETAEIPPEWPVRHPDEKTIEARLLIYASESVWKKVQHFFRYWDKTFTKARHPTRTGRIGPGVFAAELAELERIVAATVDEMRHDLGTRRMLVSHIDRAGGQVWPR